MIFDCESDFTSFIMEKDLSTVMAAIDDMPQDLLVRGRLALHLEVSILNTHNSSDTTLGRIHKIVL